MALSAADQRDLRQARLDSLAAKHLYNRRIGVLRRAGTVVDLLAIAVPLLYLPVRYLTKGQPLHAPLEVGWELLGAALLVAAVVKVIYRWPDRAEEQAVARGENMRIADELQALVVSTGGPADQVRLEVVRSRIGQQNQDDQRLLEELRPPERRRAYREALKELTPGDSTVVCPICGASPWRFRPGDCDACGNTPPRHVKE
jgi:mobilome CxxCx(11)CxxC protein